jgi:hypothetical protein
MRRVVRRLSGSHHDPHPSFPLSAKELLAKKLRQEKNEQIFAQARVKQAIEDAETQREMGEMSIRRANIFYGCAFWGVLIAWRLVDNYYFVAYGYKDVKPTIPYDENFGHHTSKNASSSTEGDHHH